MDLLLPIWLTSPFGPQPPKIPIIHIPGYVCTVTLSSSYLRHFELRDKGAGQHFRTTRAPQGSRQEPGQVLCQQPAPSASPEKHQQGPAGATSLCGVVATEGTHLPNGHPDEGSDPRQLLAQVALAFLHLPYCCLLPQINHDSAQRYHWRGTGM